MPEHDLGLGRATVGDTNLCVIREAPTGRPGLTIVLDHGGGPDFMLALKKAIDERGGSPVVREGFEALRIEAGTPLFDQDLTAANLPQEVNRDARAISFVKGCYLGQETVARLDAMGHVNKILFGAVADGETVPPVGATLRADGKDVGVVTSSAFSPGWSRGVVLGCAKVAHSKPGSAMVAAWDGGEISLTVRAWPMIP